MLKLYSSDDRFIIFRIKDMLEAEGIPCFIKNEFAIGGMGDLSPFDCSPEVWLTDEEWKPKAEVLLQEIVASAKGKDDWFCPSCKEKNDASFEICWQCGHES
jgi:hypothetical protein